MVARPGRHTPVERSRATRPPRSSNAVLGWLILIFLILVPLPLGSNRPLFWAINAACVAGLGLIYGLIWAVRRETLRVDLRELGSLPWAFGALCLYLFFQFLPIPGLHTLSVAPGATFLMLLRTLTYGFFFFLVLQVSRNPERAAFLLDALLAALAAHAVLALGLLQSGDTLLGYQKTAYLGSATGTFVNRNSFATLLAFGCVLAFTKLLHDFRQALAPRDEFVRHHTWVRVALEAVALVAIFATLVATQSRMGVAATLLGLAVVGMFGLARVRRVRAPAIIASFAILIVLGAIALLYSEGLLQRLLFTEQSWGERLELYHQVVQLIALRPLTGFGGGSFELAFQMVHRPPVGVDRVWDKAHNSYLTLFSDLGLIAGMIIPLMLGAIVWRLLSAARRGNTDGPSIEVAIGVLVVAASHSLVDFSLEIQAVTLWFVAFIAIGLAQALNSAETRSGLDDADTSPR